MPYPDLVTGDDGLSRCGWVGFDPEYVRYHDEEWGVKLEGDQQIFEKLSLEGFQAGLSWITILKRRPGFRRAFYDFDIPKVAAMTDSDVERLMSDEGIIRNRAKILATINNARTAQVMIEQSPGALHELIWSYAPPKQELPTAQSVRPRHLSDVPAQTPASVQLSKELKKRGFSFVGPTTMYALMQSAGLVDDHVLGCHRAQ